MDDKVNLSAALATFDDAYSPRIVGYLNDYKLAVVKAREEFVWHKHDDTDDFFLVLRGRLTIQLRDRDVELSAGELFVVPRGVEHCPRADEEAAARSRFGGLIVQGGVTSGLLNAVVAEDLPGPGSVFLNVDWSFKAPVRPGDEITAEVEVLEVREDKPLTKLRTTIVNQEGTVVLDGSALVWTEALSG